MIFDTTPSLLIVLKPDTPRFTILDANKAHLDATQTRREEIVDKSLFTVFPENPDGLSESAGALRGSLEKVIREKCTNVMPVIKYDVPVAAQNGTVFAERYWRVVNIPVLDENNEVLYILNQLEDMTFNVQAENRHLSETQAVSAEIRKKSLQLQENEGRIEDIMNALLKFTTMDFSERLAISDKRDELDAIAFGLNSLVDELESHMLLLRQFNKELEETNKELDSFSYSVSHDLRAPLRAISGYSRILQEEFAGQMDDEGKKLVGVVIRSAAKMGRLIDDLLAFSHAGKQSLNKVMLNMNRLVESVIHDLGADATAQTKFIVKPLKEIEGDSSLMKQVLTNLISNGIKYSSRKPDSTVEIGSYDEAQRRVYYVKDNGAGFDMTYYNKLFGVFQRLHSTAEFEGTGVGLALVQRIVKKHGGEVWAESAPGQGATFYFSLPLYP